MRKFIRENCMISSLLAISIFLVVKYSEIPYPFALLEKIDWIFGRPKADTWSYEVLRLLENLSLAYIASFIFYLLIEFFPKKKRGKDAFLVISGDLVNLYLYMSQVISVYKYICGIEKENKDVALSDLSGLPHLQIEDIVYNFKTTTIINDVEKDTCAGYFNLQHDSVKYGKLIQNTLDKISALPCTMYLDSNLLNIISEIKANQFLSALLRIENDPFVNNKIPVENMGHDKYFFEFLQSHEKLNQYDFSHHNYKTSKITDEEIRQNLERQAEQIKKNPELLKILKILNPPKS